MPTDATADGARHADPVALRAVLAAWEEACPARRRALAFLRARQTPIYLVGGTVRDALLGRKSSDVDLAVEGDALLLARQLADVVHGAFVPLDESRNVARVVLRADLPTRTLDLAGLRASGIVRDLWARDFTVNALAVPLTPDGFGELMDPTGGREDLQARRLRAIGPGSFQEDPLRVLRAPRFACALRLEIDPPTTAWALEAVSGLRRVSGERIRDELLQLLALGGVSHYLVAQPTRMALSVALPELPSSFRYLAGAANTLQQLDTLADAATSSAMGAPPLANAVDTCYMRHLRACWEEEIAGGRSRWHLLRLGVLLSETPDIPVPDIARRLRLSVKEQRYLHNLLQAIAAPLWTAMAEPDRLTIYRYLSVVREAGVDAAILRLAMCFRPPPWGDPPAKPVIMRHTGRLLKGWFEEYDLLVDPPALLNGQEIMECLETGPGPHIGHALESLREAQIRGLVSTPAEARRFLRHLQR